MQIATILFMAAFVMKMTDLLKAVYQEKRIQWPLVIALVIGAVTGVLFRLDMFSMFGIDAVTPMVAYIYTGAALATGGATLSDLFKIFEQPKR